MATKFVTVINVKTGKVNTIPRRIYEHPVFNQGQLVEVVPDTKPYVAELYKPTTAEEFVENHPEKIPTVDADAEEASESKE